MAVNVDIEIPIAITTKTQSGNPRIVARRTVMGHSFEELDATSVSHVASVRSRDLGPLEYFKHDHQFYRAVGPRPTIGETMPSSRSFSYHIQYHKPGTQLLEDIEHLFEELPQLELRQAWTSEARDTAKDVSTVRLGTYDPDQVQQQIEIRRAALDHVIAGQWLLKPVDEPHINVLDGVHLSRLPPTLGPRGCCFSFAELEIAKNLARRLKIPEYKDDTFEVLESHEFSETHLSYRMASVLNEMENVFSRVSGIAKARSILAMTEADRTLLASAVSAFDRYKAGAIDEEILDVAASFLNNLEAFGIRDSSAIVYQLLKDQWADREVTIDFPVHW